MKKIIQLLDTFRDAETIFLHIELKKLAEYSDEKLVDHYNKTFELAISTSGGSAQWIEIGGVRFDFVKPCPRCIMTTQDQKTGDRTIADPMPALRALRMSMDSRVKGVLFTVQKALPLLANHASVILTGSTAGSSGTPAFSVYSASKAAVRSFARNWILDLKDRNVRINTISPGATRTPGLVYLAGPDAAQQQGLLDYLASQIPMGRVGEPEEIANAALFLASSDASFVNGIELFVDGGQNQI